jgi:hypothetical protein
LAGFLAPTNASSVRSRAGSIAKLAVLALRALDHPLDLFSAGLTTALQVSEESGVRLEGRG